MRKRASLVLGLLVLVVLCHGAVGTANDESACRTALLVIDVQPVWLRGALYTSDTVWISDKIAEILDLVRPTDIHVVYILDVSRRGEVSEESLGFPEQFAPANGELTSEKLYGNAFYETDLGDDLRDLGVATLLISGLASQSCVRATLNGAIDEGFEVIVIADGHTGGMGGRQARLRNADWIEAGLQVTSSSELDFDELCAS